MYKNKSQIPEIRNQLTQIIDLASRDDKLAKFSIDNINNLTNHLERGLTVPEVSMIPLNQQLVPHNISPFYNQYPIDLNHMGSNSEKVRIQQLLHGFDQKVSPAWKTITTAFGPDVKQISLCELALQLSKKLGITLNRDAKRRKSVLIKWFHDNWDILKDEINNYQLDGDHIVEISHSIITE